MKNYKFILQDNVTGKKVTLRSTAPSFQESISSVYVKLVNLRSKTTNDWRIVLAKEEGL